LNQKLSNKRVYKNTGMLYIRMILTMLVSLYTSRVVLSILGVEDYGIYNVVSGFVIALGFLNSAMTASTQRFLSYEVGVGGKTNLREIFVMSFNIHIIISLVFLFLSQTLGYWFVSYYLNFPASKLDSVYLVYQFAVLTFIIEIISIPYNAIIIANERMKFYAWVSIADVILKLLLVYALEYTSFEKLSMYSFLMLISTFIVKLIYFFYCNIHFKEAKLFVFWSKNIFIKIISFTLWNLWGSISGVLQGQGINILLNVFFGPSINAARGISYQIKAAVTKLVSNFQVAMNPQIVKSYAMNEIQYMHNMIFQGAKISFFLAMIITLPILIETDSILKLWLEVVPEYTNIFTQLIIINILIDSLSGPLMTAAQASGKIKFYQTIIGGIMILTLPFAYLLLKLKEEPEMVFYAGIFIAIITLVLRIIIVSKLIGLSIKGFIYRVILRVLPILIITFSLSSLIKLIMIESVLRLLLTSAISMIFTFIFIYIIGLNNNERSFLRKTVNKYVKIS